MSGIHSLVTRGRSRGDPRIRIAVLDGPVDLSHRCFAGASIKAISSVAGHKQNGGMATRHGTHIASIIFAQDAAGPLQGIAPACEGLLIPIFSDGPDGSLLSCSQLDLARAILLALEHGAHIINISGGQLSASGLADPILAEAVQTCARQNVLIVAAAGNNGCDCVHLPAAIDPVLAVGAANAGGIPLDSSNWGMQYQESGVLAPGQNIAGAAVGGGIARSTGTSYATPIVSGVAALLLSQQVQLGNSPDPLGVRRTLLDEALPCSSEHESRCLAGHINIFGMYKTLTQGATTMSGAELLTNIETRSASDLPIETRPRKLELSQLQTSADQGASILPSELPELGVTASHGCGCGGTEKACACKSDGPSLVFALGKLGFDFGTQARRDSFTQNMGNIVSANPGSPDNPGELIPYLRNNPEEAQAMIWTLNHEATPIYAIVPTGAYAAGTFRKLMEILEQLQNKDPDKRPDVVSLPGSIVGNVRLMSGQVVPAVMPDHNGLRAWGVRPLARMLIDYLTKQKKKPRFDGDAAGALMESYFNKIYFEHFNLGLAPQERALNYSAVNALQVAKILEEVDARSEFDSISVNKSSICRPDSECYDVMLRFFIPDNMNISNRVFKFTIDVSDVRPVAIGDIRTWASR